MALLTDSYGNAQPVTTAPLIEIHPTTRQRVVMVGTGRLLASTDISTSAAQTFYAILDGSAGGFSSIVLPITRLSLTPVSNITVGITLSGSSKGWYYDLGSSGGTAYRIVVTPRAYNGVVAFATLLTGGDACSPSGSSQVYAVNYLTGTSVISATQTGSSTNTGAVTASVTTTNAVTDLRFVVLNGSPELLAGTSTGELKQIYASLSGTTATRLLNWRELPTPY
jgi:type IV pilus assembly protein PilY1